MKEKFTLKTVVVGILQENCYLLMNNETKKIAAIDPGDEPHNILKAIEEMDGEVEAIILTHSHHDHIGAIPELRQKYPDAEYIVCADEKVLMNERSEYFSKKTPFEYAGEPTKWVSDGDILDVAGAHLLVMQTPGHTIGSTCYYEKELGLIFTGDTLFKCSCGRTDLKTGDPRQMPKSLHRLATEVEPETVVLPGHDANSTIGFEKEHNPYMRS